MPRSAIFAAFLTIAALPAPALGADSVSVADPAGGARWTAHQSTGAGGRICVAVRHGRRSHGRRCARLSGRLAFSYDVRTESNPNPRRVRTIFVVALAPDVVTARLSTPDGRRTYRRRAGRPRVLLAVLAGRVERVPLRVEVRRNGRSAVVVQGAPPAVQVRDPLGGPAWRSVWAAGSGGDGTCAAWERVPPRYAAPPRPVRGTPRCGDEDADVPVAAAEVVDGRLVIFGVAGAAVRSLVLRGAPGGDRDVPLETKTRALLTVLPGGTDPATLRLVARLGDGRLVERPLDVVR